jgi:flagellar biogenesis protein FliO
MEWIRQVSAVSGVLLLLGAALWWLRRKGLAQYGMRPSTGARKRTLESVERLALGPQHSLHLVRLAGRGLLVGTSPTGCAVLESFEWAPVESASAQGVR